MANTLPCRRKKCVKSANCFRDRQEYSSLYTISSHSASSIHSSEMAAQIAKQNHQQHRAFPKGENYQGDSTLPMRKTPQTTYMQQFTKTPKCTCNITNEVYQNIRPCGHRSCYNDSLKYVKQKFDSLSLNPADNRTSPCYNKPYCPVHNCKPKCRTNLKNLEECYWATWKPSKNECMPASRNYHEYDCPKRRPYCGMVQDYGARNHPPVEIIREPRIFDSHSSEENPPHDVSAKDLYNQVLNEYQHQVINECQINKRPCPARKGNKMCRRAIRDETTDQNADEQQSEIPVESQNNEPDAEEENFEEPPENVQETSADVYEPEELKEPEQLKRSESEIMDARVRFRSRHKVEEFDPSIIYDYRLYNEMYNEYENEFMNRIEEDEQEKTEQEYQQFYDEMYHEYENELLSRMPSGYTESSLEPDTERLTEEEGGKSTGEETERFTGEDTERTAEDEMGKLKERAEDTSGDQQGSVTVLHKADSQQRKNLKELTTSDEYSASENLLLKHTDSFIINSRRQKQERARALQPKFLQLSKTIPDPPPLKGHTYPLKSALKKDKPKPAIGFIRPTSPMKGSKNYLPAYLQRINTK